MNAPKTLLGLIVLLGSTTLSGCELLQCPEGFHLEGLFYCVSDSAPGIDSGQQRSSNPSAEVGDMCFGDADCAADQLCMMQDAGDFQGICTVSCVRWTDCTSSEIGQSFWDCCDVPGGTAACFPDDWCDQ